MIELEHIAARVEPQVIEARRYLHQHPYTRWHEQPNLDWLLQQIERDKSTFAWRHRDEFSGGLVIDLIVNDSLPWRLFRADIDALPITEATGLPFASQHDGVMHACGHDAHSAMLLGAFNAIQSGALVPSCNTRWVWQRAEENPGTPPIAESGGARLVREGVCDGVQSAHGLHIWAETQAGVFESRGGAAMANSGRIKITVRCRGGHVASPHSGSNAARIAQQIGAALEGFQHLVLNPLETVVLEPTIIQTGTASNVRPAEAELWFANRNFLAPDALRDYKRKLEARIRSVVQAYDDASVEIEFMDGHPVLVNDESDVARVSSLLREEGQSVETNRPTFGGEDFAHYLARVPGSFWFLGAHQEGTGGHHTPLFNPDESVLRRGVLFWLLLAKGNAH